MFDIKTQYCNMYWQEKTLFMKIVEKKDPLPLYLNKSNLNQIDMKKCRPIWE